jgi:hypothetical protein
MENNFGYFFKSMIFIYWLLFFGLRNLIFSLFELTLEIAPTEF